jgi:cytochrome c peroxidase
MLVSKHQRNSFAFLTVVAVVTVGYDSAKSASPKQTGDSQTAQHAPPIPPDGPLAAPKPLKQVGPPVEATRATVPGDNPQTSEKIALGEKLFFDGRLSADGTVACSSCHNPALPFTDGRPVSIGIKGRAGQRNSPTILNALYNAAQFWDGRVFSRRLDGHAMGRAGPLQQR